MRRTKMGRLAQQKVPAKLAKAGHFAPHKFDCQGKPQRPFVTTTRRDNVG